jgi:Holliday junction resolvasome RuvABC ATP-dependent DNA helicase subunit
MMAEDIKTYLAPAHRTHFKMADWQSLRNTLGVLPLGLTRLELRVLRVLEHNRDVTLTRLAASLQMTPASVRADLELHLLKTGLISINTGRNLTSTGQAYLKLLTTQE